MNYENHDIYTKKIYRCFGIVLLLLVLSLLVIAVYLAFFIYTVLELRKELSNLQLNSFSKDFTDIGDKIAQSVDNVGSDIKNLNQMLTNDGKQLGVLLNEIKSCICTSQ